MELLSLLPTIDRETEKKVEKEVVKILKEYRALKVRFENEVELQKRCSRGDKEMTKDILDELLKWKNELEKELKTIVQVEQERELYLYTLMRKIDVLEKVKEKLNSERKREFETARIEPLRGSLTHVELEIQSKEEYYKTKKEELEEIIDTLQVQIDELYKSAQ